MTGNVAKIFRENGTNNIKWKDTALKCYRNLGDIYEIQALQTIGIMNIHAQFTKYGTAFVNGTAGLNKALIPKVTSVKKNRPSRSKSK